MRLLFLAVMLWEVLAAATPARAIPVLIHYVNGSMTADAILDVEDGHAVGGTGTISGDGLIGTLPIVYLAPGSAPAPLTAAPAADCGPGASGCYDVGTFSCGCDFVGQDTIFDTTRAIPVDAGGIAFQVGGPAINYGLALYDAGDGTVGEILVGDASPQPVIFDTGTPGGALDIRVVAEPSSLACLCASLVFLSAVPRRNRAKTSVCVPTPALREAFSLGLADIASPDVTLVTSPRVMAR